LSLTNRFARFFTWDANSDGVASDTDIDMDTNNEEHEPMKIRYSINKKGESMNGMHPMVGLPSSNLKQALQFNLKHSPSSNTWIEY